MNHTTTLIFQALLRNAQRDNPGLQVTLTTGRASEFPRSRDYAYCTTTRKGLQIVVAPKFLHASPERQAGLLAHELGHAVLMHRGQMDHPEVLADEVGGRLARRRVRYDGEDVQTLGRGKGKRPKYLHQ